MDDLSVWSGSLVLGAIYAVVILVPCVLTALMGKKLITELGNYPTRAPLIHMKILYKFVLLEIVTITLLIMVYHVLGTD